MTLRKGGVIFLLLKIIYERDKVTPIIYSKRKNTHLNHQIKTYNLVGMKDSYLVFQS